MKKLTLLLALVALALFSTAAMADSVTFSTAGTFVCGSIYNTAGQPTCAVSAGGTVVTITTGAGNAFALQFTGQTSNTVNANPFSFVHLGSINSFATVTGSNFIDAFPDTLAGGTADDVLLAITITQTVPNSGSGNVIGELTGGFTADSSTGDVHFFAATNSTQIGAVSYTAFDTVLADPAAANAGLTTIQGSATVPEPASLALLGTGLLAGGGFVRRKLIAR